MKIAIIGSTGRAGSRIMAEALKRHHEVTGYSRTGDQGVQGIKGIQKDLFQLTEEDLKGFDAVVSAFSTWGDQSLHLKAAEHLDRVMKNLDTRWVTVGGAGSLFVAEGLMLKDSEGFPEAYKAVADGMTEALEFLQSSGESNWSFFSPAAVFEPGEATGRYRFGQDQLLSDPEGNSVISMEDYATALIDVLENKTFNRQRFTAVRG